MVAGRFEHFWPSEVAIWLQICPFAAYTQEVYDREQREVIEKTTSWYEFNEHFVPRNQGKSDKRGKRLEKSFICSCDARRSTPCYGCAYRKAFFEWLDKMEQEKGVRPDKKPACGRSNRFGLNVTIKERVFAVPQRDGNGKVKKTKDGQIIYRHIPAPRLDDDESSEAFKSVFGHNMHWTLGTNELNGLLADDERLKNCCANCASDLYATHMICPSCETVIELDEAVTKEDLDTQRNKVRTCKACHDKIAFYPKLECAECGDPKEGSLLMFDIRVKRTKLADKTYKTEIVAIRVPGTSSVEDNARVEELLQNPIDLSKVFAPTPLTSQKYILGDLAEKIDPASCIVKPDDETESETETESYVDNPAEDDIEF